MLTPKQIQEQTLKDLAAAKERAYGRHDMLTRRKAALLDMFDALVENDLAEKSQAIKDIRKKLEKVDSFIYRNEYLMVLLEEAEERARG